MKDKQLMRLASNLEQAAKTMQLHARIIEANGEWIEGETSLNKIRSLYKSREEFILKTVAEVHKELEEILK